MAAQEHHAGHCLQRDDDEPQDAEIVEDTAPGPVPAPDRDPGVLGSVISDDRSPSFESVGFRLAPGAAVSPGMFVVAEAGTAGEPTFVLCRVLGAHEVNPHEDALSSTVRSVLPFGSQYAKEGSSTVIYRIARTEPLEEFPLDHDGRPGDPHEVRSIPLAGGLVLAAGADLVQTAMGFPDSTDAGLHIGAMHTDPSVPVTLVKDAVQRHVLIVGGIGSGKSYTRGVLGEELHLHGVPQVNIDVNGEMISACAELGGVNLVPGAGFTLPLSALTREDLLESVSGVQRGTNIETLIGYTFDVHQREVRQNRRTTFGVDDLVDEIETQAPLLQMQAANTLRPAQQRTRALERMNYIGQAFNWETALVPGAFVNIDCRSMLIADLRIITAAVARALQGLARHRRIPFTVLSIDEFHLVAPNDDRNVSTQVLRRSLGSDGTTASGCS